VNEQALREGNSHFGFQVESIRELSEYRSTGVRLTHLATGAQVYHLANDDRENLFCFSFRTPSEDNTGVPHILEHAVLAGSQRFPLKDPFAALLKGSMQTFLNAMTFPDKTVYPASSMVEKDFYNLMLVYGDAVFFPLLKEEVFKQEGHHLEFRELEDVTSGLKVVGVVYNEMQGRNASPETIAAEWSQRSLFPDSIYGFDSGGDPADIPSLTYEEFLAFHRRYYHPSNCKIFLYGNIPTLKHLEFLEAHFLSRCSRLEIDSDIPLQPRWSAPRRREVTYAVKEEDSLEKKSSITLNWLLVPITDPLAVLTLEVLSEVLIGNAGSPLRKALIESKLGEDLAPITGLETELKEVTFTVGLRGSDPAQQEALEALIMKTLADVAERGVEEEAVRSALHRVEFRNREIRGGQGPYALVLLRKCLAGWLHETEPETTLEFARWMNQVKEKLLGDKKALSEVIVRELLENPHRATVLVRPDPEHSRREEERLAQSLQEKEATLSEADKQELVRSVLELKSFQEAPDPPEQLNEIPFLRHEDLPREVERIPAQEDALSGAVPLWLHDVFTNGIVYLDFALDTVGMDAGRVPLLPLFGKAVCGAGLPGEPYDEVARKLALLTGGFSAQVAASAVVADPAEVRSHLFFRMKALQENLAPALALVQRLLLSADFDDEARVRDLLLELKNEFKAYLIPNGHQFVSLRAGSRLSPALAMEEKWRGVSQLAFLNGLASGDDAQAKGLREGLAGIRDSLLTRERLTIAVTAERALFAPVKEALSELVAAFPAGAEMQGATAPEELPQAGASSRHESLVIPSPVGYVAKAVRGATWETKEGGYEAVLSHFLRTGFLWERVRMRGGAYGAFAASSGTEGVFIFSSYRDPNILSTLQAYREALDYARQGEIDSDQIGKAIIGTVGKDEKPLDPGDKGMVSLRRKLCGITDELRQARRSAILSVDRKALTLAAERLLEGFAEGPEVVMSNERALRQAGEQAPELLTTITEVPL
jgi:presequence protease